MQRLVDRGEGGKRKGREDEKRGERKKGKKDRGGKEEGKKYRRGKEEWREGEGGRGGDCEEKLMCENP